MTPPKRRFLLKIPGWRVLCLAGWEYTRIVEIGPDFHVRNSFAFGYRRAENEVRSAHDGRRDWGRDSVKTGAAEIGELKT
jgi:hypothetical protein